MKGGNAVISVLGARGPVMAEATRAIVGRGQTEGARARARPNRTKKGRGREKKNVSRECEVSSTPRLLGSSASVSGTPYCPVKPGDDGKWLQWHQCSAHSRDSLAGNDGRGLCESWHQLRCYSSETLARLKPRDG